jgi:hypothetical protein
MTTSTMTRTIDTTAAQEFWRDAATAYGRALDTDELEQVDQLTDIEILGRWFGDLNDAEQQELLWAYGGFLADRPHAESG